MDNREFDYLVIGAGSAGCVLANRLSCQSGGTVGVIEAGGEHDRFLVNMPMGSGKTIHMDRYAWRFRGEPEPFSMGRSYYHPRGRILGGSSSINGMIYIRGQAEDYDAWAANGAVGWDWQSVLPYFKKSESQQRGGDDWHGADGPMRVEDYRHHHPVEDRLIEAAVRLGLPLNSDFNGASQAGIGRYQATMRSGKRCSTATAYLDPVRQNSNLEIMTQTLVERILFDHRVACAVEVSHAGQRHRIRARREIILSAGTFQSPQLLQLSGIGPADLLRQFGIDIQVDAPRVGQNLHDHVGAVMSWRMKQDAASLNRRMRFPFVLLEMLRYLLLRGGAMTLPAASVGIFADSTGHSRRPDVQFHCLPLSGDIMAELEHGEIRLSDFPGFTIMPYAMRPKSRGSIRIRSRRASEPPAILMNYFSEREDLETLVRGMRLADAIAKTEPLSDWVAERVYPEPMASDSEGFEAYARRYGHTGYHPVGTCAMGDSEQSVVDDSLRVRGVRGLRVVDASVMPAIVSGNTNAAVVMIAEKAADMILA